MALENPLSKEYLRIESVRFDREYVCTIDYKIYANKLHRENGDSQYMASRFGSVNSGILQFNLNGLADNNLSIIDNTLRAGYEAIKADNFEFSSWVDA